MTTQIHPEDFIKVLRTQLGNPYVLGAAGPHSDDCSGLVCYGYAHWGEKVIHHAAEQQSLGSAVSLANVRIGDLVFSNWDVPLSSIKFGKSPAAHVGVAISSSQMIVAPHTGTVVQIESFTTAGYLKRLTGIRRYLMLPPLSDATNVLGSRTLRLTTPKHMQGPDVLALQVKVGAGRDSDFGPETANKLGVWQTQHMGKAQADEVFGPLTAKAMGVPWTA